MRTEVIDKATKKTIKIGDTFQHVEHDKVRKLVIDILNDETVLIQDALGNRREMSIETLLKRYFYTNSINMTAWNRTKLNNQYLAYQVKQQSVKVKIEQEKQTELIEKLAKADVQGLNYYEACMRCLTESVSQPDCSNCTVLKEVQYGTFV